MVMPGKIVAKPIRPVPWVRACSRRQGSPGCRRCRRRCQPLRRRASGTRTTRDQDGNDKDQQHDGAQTQHHDPVSATAATNLGPDAIPTCARNSVSPKLRKTRLADSGMVQPCRRCAAGCQGSTPRSARPTARARACRCRGAESRSRRPGAERHADADGNVAELAVPLIESRSTGASRGNSRDGRAQRRDRRLELGMRAGYDVGVAAPAPGRRLPPSPPAGRGRRVRPTSPGREAETRKWSRSLRSVSSRPSAASPRLRLHLRERVHAGATAGRDIVLSDHDVNEAARSSPPVAVPQICTAASSTTH